MKAEIVLTDNNINIDLNEPTIDVSTEDGFSVTIIGGVGPQGNRGPEGPRGPKGDDYALTEEDKDDIAGMAAEKIDLSDVVRTADHATTGNGKWGVVKVLHGLYADSSGLMVNKARPDQIKAGNNQYFPIVPYSQHESVFYGLAKAAGADISGSDDPVGTYTEAAKTAIQIMLGIDLTEFVRKTDYASNTDPGVIKLLNNYGLYNNSGFAAVYKAPLGEIKAGLSAFKPIVPSNQHEAVFYGLAKAAGMDMSDSDNVVGTYTEAAMTAIRTMLGAIGREDYAGVTKAGVIKIINNYGLSMLNGVITTFPASAETIKAASNNTYGSYHPITPIRQHHAVFYGLAKAAGDVTQQESDNAVGAYTDAAKTAIRAMLGVPSTDDIPSVPVEDVQANGTSVLQNGVANIPYATQNTFGVTAIGDGLQRSSSNKVMICCATASQTKAGLSAYYPICPNTEHAAAFYGLAKAAGDMTQSLSANDIGAYTEEAKAAIRSMLGAIGPEDYASVDMAGVVKVRVGDNGLRVNGGYIMTYPATSSDIKAGAHSYRQPAVNRQHESTFYGLAKAAGDLTQAESENAVGVYTDAAKIAIRAMLGVPSTEDIPSIPVGDVQLNGVSVVSEGIANVPCANTNVLGVVQTEAEYGITVMAGTQGKLRIQQASAAQVRAGQQAYKPIVPANQHLAVFYGLAAAAGADMASSSDPVGTYTDQAKSAIRTMLGVPGSDDIPEVPVEDVQIGGTSILDNGVANIPIARSSTPGVVKLGTSNRGISALTDGSLLVSMADNTMIREGYNSYRPIVPNSQHSSTFYGLAKAAGVDMASSSNPVGSYTAEAKAAIRAMLGLDDTSIVDIVQTGLPMAEGVAW